MTDIQEKPTLTFEGKTHVIEDLSDRAKYFVGQLQDLQQQASATRAKLDQLDMARQGFENFLREELNAPAEEPEVVEPPVQ
jgi:hypothetical protein